MSYDPGQQQAWSSPHSPSYGDFYGEGEKFRGADKVALIALTVSVMLAMSCIPLVNCVVPFAPLVTGIMALAQSKNAVNVSRARTYGWIATIIGLIYLIAIAAIVFLYGAVILAAIQDIQRQM